MSRMSGYHADVERREIVKLAKELPVSDAIFLVIHYNEHHRTLGPGPSCPPIRIPEIAPHLAEHEVNGWSLRARKLRSEAHNAGEALILANDNFDWLRSELEENNPGFGRISYVSAIGYGIFQIRNRN